MAGRYNKPVQCGRESAHKSRAASGNGTLGDCMWRDQHLLGDVGDHQQGLGEVSSCGLCWAKQLGDFFSMREFCWHEYFVDVRILSTRVFCRRQYFVDANILSMPTFCRLEYCVHDKILPTPIFSVDRNISVAANILSPPIFCQRQYFVAANIFVYV